MQFEAILTGFVFLEAPRVDEHGHLWFSDIMLGGVHRLSPDGRIDSFVTDRMSIGGLALTEDGGFVCSGDEGLEYCHPVTGQRRRLALSCDGRPLGSINDIQPDDDGSLLAGTTDFASMRAGRRPEMGALYRIDPPERVSLLQPGVLVSNGLGFSPDRRRLYYAESRDGICVYDVQPDRSIAGRRLLAALRGADGLAVDAEEGIWVASYDTSEVLRYLPDGTVHRRIDFSGMFPGCKVTSLTFGGADLRDLYVVTAGDYRKPAERSGAVYKARSDVAGQPTPKARFTA